MEGNHSRLIQMKARGSDDWISDAIKEDSVEFEKQWFVDIDEEEIRFALQTARSLRLQSIGLQFDKSSDTNQIGMSSVIITFLCAKIARASNARMVSACICASRVIA